MAPTMLSRSTLQARRRAIVKTLCYRLFMLAITVAIAFVVIGDVGDALNIGLAANVLKTGTYYLYERLWDRIAWGVETA